MTKADENGNVRGPSYTPSKPLKSLITTPPYAHTAHHL